MNARIVASTCALLVSTYGIAPAAAESFNDQGWDWTMASPMPAAASTSHPQSLPPDGSFAYSWGGGATPSQYRGPAASSTDLATGQRCEAPPRVGFNQRNTFPTC
ncbi:MAG TPA: hypothetical protein P5534_17130 [Candidatus Paceibacterota bacterium]|nr:hypothetical protein [Candidatus Paceibacterota bacterium]